MAEITVKKLSKILGASVETLLQQMQDAGIEVGNASDVVTDRQKLDLLEHIRQMHTASDTAPEAKKIILKKRSPPKDKLKFSGVSGKEKNAVGFVVTEFEAEDYGLIEDLEEVNESFDPKKVDVSITTPNLGTLIARLKYGEINLMPEFQRSADLWTKRSQSRLIESILIRLPIPAFYFDAAVDDKWQVVDGLQRLSAIKNFVVDKTLSLTNLEFLTDFEGCSYDDLPRPLQRRIEEFQTSVYLIKPGTPLPMKFALFNRINTGGLKLNPQEIRHAMSQSVRNGAASSFLTQLIESSDFKLVVTNKNNRMAHQELALRHISFVLLGLESYKSSLSKFMDRGMISLGEKEDVELSELRLSFLASLKVAFIIFGEDSFKRSSDSLDHKKLVNKPLFESLSVCLALSSGTERLELILKKGEVLRKFNELLKNKEFVDSISQSTSNTDSVYTRFSMVNSTIKYLLPEA